MVCVEGWALRVCQPLLANKPSRQRLYCTHWRNAATRSNKVVLMCAGSTNDSYAPAWLAAAPSPAAAADDLERAVLASVEGSDIIQQVTLASGAEYRAFTAPR